MRRHLLSLMTGFAILGAVLLPAQAAFAAPLDQGCQHREWVYDPGKTPEGFEARATDGCNTYHWTGSLAQGPGSGTVTFKTTDTENHEPWKDNGLPSMAGGEASYCRARAANEATRLWIFGFKSGPGVEVTVTYRCD